MGGEDEVCDSDEDQRVLKILKERHQSRDQGLNGKVILSKVFIKCGVRLRTMFYWVEVCFSLTR